MNQVDIHKIEELDNIKQALIQIASALNRSEITWGLGGSLLLYLYGIKTTVADIDIVIDEKDIDKVEALVSTFFHFEKPESGIYLTTRFFSVTHNDVGIDLMLGFKIKTRNGIFAFPEGKAMSHESVILENTRINICSLDDWLEAYEAMQRMDKVTLIKQFKKINEEKKITSL